MIVWRIEGEAANDSGGGDTTILAVTPDETTLPDPHKALEIASPRCSWYRIISVTQVADLPDAWDEDDYGRNRLVDPITNLVSERRVAARQLEHRAHAT